MTRHTDVSATVQEIKALVEYYGYSLSKAAETLGLSSNYVYKLSSIHNIRGRRHKKEEKGKNKLTFCPDCLEAKVYTDPENGERVCTGCGYVLEQQADMVHRLPFDETYALESGLAFNKSLGVADTVRRRYGYTKILAKTRNNVSKIEFVEEILGKWKSGGMSAIVAGEEIREVLVKGGAPEIAKTILERKDEKPAELAKRIVNMFDAIPTRQIMTLHEEYDPPLLRKMKEYGNRFLQEAWEALSRFCDPKMFGHSYGGVIEKVGSAALVDPDVKHSPKDLAAACFITSLFQINPNSKVSLSYAPNQDALKYVDMVMSPFWNEKLEWKGGGDNDWRKTKT
jgi:hypothetical protein